MRWVRSQLGLRKRHIVQILENIRLVTVDRAYLEDVIEKDQLIQESETCKQLIEQAKIYQETNDTNNTGMFSIIMCQGVCFSVVFAT